MNKIEKFFNLLTKDADYVSNDCSLLFSLEDDVQIIFTRGKLDDEETCFLNIIIMNGDSFKKKTQFDFPIFSIYEFLKKHTDKNHLLIKGSSPGSLDDREDDYIYNLFIESINNLSIKEIKAEFLKIHLEISINDENIKNIKKSKI